METVKKDQLEYLRMGRLNVEKHTHLLTRDQH